MPRRHEGTKITDHIWRGYQLSAISYRLSAIGFTCAPAHLRTRSLTGQDDQDDQDDQDGDTFLATKTR